MYGKDYSINEDSEKSNVVRLSWNFIRFCQFLMEIVFWQNLSEKDTNQICFDVLTCQQWDLFRLPKTIYSYDCETNPKLIQIEPIVPIVRINFNRGLK